MKKLILLSFVVILTSVSIHAEGMGEELASTDCSVVNGNTTDSQESVGSHDAASSSGKINN
jgi:hypothetical protein